MAIPTAAELADQIDNDYYKKNGYYQSRTEPITFACNVALAFAEAHRQEALKQASNKARTQHVVTRGTDFYIVNKDSILNAYSKKNIK